MTFRGLLVASAVLAVAGCATRHHHYEEPRRVELGPIAGGVVGQAIARGSSVPGSQSGPAAHCRSDDRCGRYHDHDDRDGRGDWDDGSRAGPRR